MDILGIKAAAGLELKVSYYLYPKLPVIRKEIEVLNISRSELRLEALFSEKLVLDLNFVESACFTNYGRQKHLGSYVGNWDDPLLAIHNYHYSRGLLVGNEAPGVLKHVDYNVNINEVNAGLTQLSDPYPFRKYIASGKAWKAPAVFLIPYSRYPDPAPVINTTLADFQRRHMALRIYKTPHRASFMYNTWLPFRDQYNDTLIEAVAAAAARCGIRQFVLDCGWNVTNKSLGKSVSWLNNCGDWIPDPAKFPHGLKPVFDSVRRLGMEPGL